LFKEAESYKRQIVGIEELRKDRDSRVEALRCEIEELTAVNEEVVKTNASLSVKFNSIEQLHSKLEDDYARVNEHLSLANNVRSNAEE